MTREDGSITLITIGMVLALLLVGYGITAASMIHLQRVHTQALTEDLAGRAAAAVDEAAYLEAGGGRPVVPAAVAKAAIEEHLQTLGGDVPPEFHLVEIHTDPDGVLVRAGSIATPVFLPERLWPVSLAARAEVAFVAGGAAP